MTIPVDNYVPTKDLGNGSTVDFSYTWNVIASENIRVFLEDVVTGLQVLQTLDSDFTLVFTSSSGIVTFGTAPTNADYVIIARDIAKTQETGYSTSSGFQGVVTENSFDKLTAISQDLTEISNRTLTFPLGSGFSTTVPLPLDGTVLGWSDDVLVNVTSIATDTLPIVADNFIVRNSGNTAFIVSTLPTDNAALIVTNAADIATNTTAIDLYKKDYINGGIVSNDSVTPDELINISELLARSSDNTKDIEVDALIDFDITANASWESGTAPSLTSISVYLWAVWDATTPYFIFDDVTGSNITPAKIMVGAFLTDSSGDIIPFEVFGNGDNIDYVYDVPLEDATLAGTSYTEYDASIPVGISAKVNMFWFAGTTSADVFNIVAELSRDGTNSYWKYQISNDDSVKTYESISGEINLIDDKFFIKASASYSVNLVRYLGYTTRR